MQLSCQCAFKLLYSAYTWDCLLSSAHIFSWVSPLSHQDELQTLNSKKNIFIWITRYLSFNVSTLDFQRGLKHFCRRGAFWQRGSDWHVCTRCCGSEAVIAANLLTTLQQRSHGAPRCKCHVVRRGNKTRWLLMSCQRTAALWRQIAPCSGGGCLSSGCHQLFIPLSLSTQTLHHLPTGLMVVVLRTITPPSPPP